MTEEQAKELLQKYLDQQASPQEQKKVEEWYATLHVKDVVVPADRKAAIGAQMFAQLQLAMRDDSKTGKVFKLQSFIRIAAAVFLILTIGISVWKLNTKVPSENQVTVFNRSKQQKRITLSDGSVVLLGPSAKLCYPKTFASNSRQIELKEGEAFFDIAHQEKRPFTVHTSAGVNIKVLGTSFKVKSYQASKQLEVAVITGKVAVSNLKGALGTLVKDEFLTCNKNNGCAAISKIKAPAFIGFAFDGASLDQVIAKLQYVYSIKILLSDSGLGKLKTTASFSSKQSPEEILDIICSLHHLKFNASKNHKTFNIYR
ncbi:ferric-dicitrate binding protein FerR, regulates iron transport through sigma-19 [Pedobacter terrae]|uniref:Ferric-dicitrate binding protein FerR, regulates iron transport through sigma-19 n=1 Tax=Pedobacter terrae TaxID=405671 RepID=A0A1G7WNL1_9SPHI|nr:FecR family protein [Pedobacter terrae]SDG73489.1 ferric-dicitrate binding protein FerR, regulates iron transport through sigma-19 [Pedobacter terrae]